MVRLISLTMNLQVFSREYFSFTQDFFLDFCQNLSDYLLCLGGSAPRPLFPKQEADRLKNFQS